MPRKWKNSDDNTFFVDKAVDGRLEKLRIELIPNHMQNKNQKKYFKNNKKTDRNQKNK